MASAGNVGQPRPWLLALLLVVSWLPLTACGLLPVKYSAEPIDAQVVDAETGTPLKGVVVVAHWVLEGGIHVDRVGELKILEAVTDKDGRFHFAGWGPIWHKGASRLTYMDPELILFKSGYEYQRLENERTPEALGGKPYQVRRSDWNGRTIKLKRFRGALSDYSKHFEELNRDYKFILNNPSECMWKMIPRTISLVHQERLVLEAKDIKNFYSIDNHLISNEEYFSAKTKCGSVGKFIREVSR